MVGGWKTVGARIVGVQMVGTCMVCADMDGVHMAAYTWTAGGDFRRFFMEIFWTGGQACAGWGRW